jgi:hypothetical protein
MPKTPAKPLGFVKRSSDFLYDHFKTIVVWLIAGIVVTDLFNKLYSPQVRLVLFILFSASFLILVPNFIIHKGMRSIRNLIRNQEITIGEIILDYCLAAVSVILFFAMLYSVADTADIGRLQYGGCEQGLRPDVDETGYAGLSTPSAMSHYNTIYFSAITFFTVGYGDICPVGVDKLLSILNAWAGVLINIIVISVAIGQYLNSGRNGGKKEEE